MVRYDPYTDSFVDNPTKETTATISLEAFPKSIVQMVGVSDESIEKIADAVVRELTARKTENSSEIPNNCKDEQTERLCTNCKHNGVLSVPKCDECHDMDKYEFIEPQTDCPWK